MVFWDLIKKDYFQSTQNFIIWAICYVENSWGLTYRNVGAENYIWFTFSLSKLITNHYTNQYKKDWYGLNWHKKANNFYKLSTFICSSILLIRPACWNTFWWTCRPWVNLNWSGVNLTQNYLSNCDNGGSYQ